MQLTQTHIVYVLYEEIEYNEPPVTINEEFRSNNPLKCP